MLSRLHGPLAAFMLIAVPLAAPCIGCATEAVVHAEPPPERAETPGAAPSAQHFWVRGNWRWDGREYAWSPGHWEGARADAVWVQGHWRSVSGGGWVWIDGRWAVR